MTNLLARILATVVALTVTVSANWTKFYSTPTTDSSEIAKKYWARSFDEKKGTTTKLEVTAERAIKVTATWGNVPKWGAIAGIRQPMTKNWDAIDFSKVTSVQFTYRTAAGVPAQFALGSDAYPLKEQGVLMSTELRVATAWRTVTVKVPNDLGYLSWMETDFPEAFNTTWDDVKSSIKYMDFSPISTYDDSGKVLKKVVSSLEVKDITIIGDFGTDLGTRTEAKGTGCTGISYELAEVGSNKNPQGGWWYAYTDTTSGTPNLYNGGSTIDTTSEGSLEFTDYGIRITTTLNKKANGIYQPYSGWARIGTGFQTAGRDKERDLTGITAFSFAVQYNADFDVEKVGGVNFKVMKASVGDLVAFMKPLPASQTGMVCIDLAELKQPAWYTKRYNVNTPFTANDILGFAWELKIEDELDSTINQSGPNSVEISSPRIWSGNTPLNLNLWQEPPIQNICSWCGTGNVPPTIGIETPVSRLTPFFVAYQNGLVLSYDVTGNGSAKSAKVEITRLDGTKVASLNAGASADKSKFNINLTRGTYLVIVKGGATSMSRVLVVAR